MEYYSTIRKDEVSIHATKWIRLETFCQVKDSAETKIRLVVALGWRKGNK